MQIVRLFLTPDTLNPPNIRWNEECDCIQQTPDGGTTWIDVPALDPRHADGFRLPPLTGEDARCDAAARMVAYLHKLVDIDLLAITNWGLASVLLQTLLLVIPAGVLVDLLLLISDVVLAIGFEAINSAFTSGVYDDLVCTYFCHLDADGQLSESALAALAVDIEANYSSVVLAVWTVHNQTLWEVGWSNAGVVGTETGQCDECSCSACETSFGGDGQNDWQPGYPEASVCDSTYDSGNDWIVGQECTAPAEGSFQAICYKTLTGTITHVDITVYGLVSNVTTAGFYVRVDGTFVFSDVAGSDGDEPHVTFHYDFSPPLPTGEVVIVYGYANNANDPITGTLNIESLTVCTEE